MISFTLPGKSILSPKKPPALAPLPPIPTGDDPSEAARKEEERLTRRRRSGLGKTRLTSPGLGDISQGSLDRTTATSKLGGN